MPFVETLICWVVTTVLGLTIIKDLIWWTSFFKWQYWANTHVWQGLAVFVVFHFCVCGLALLYRRIFPQLSLVFIYLGLQLFFYLLFLIKGFWSSRRPYGTSLVDDDIRHPGHSLGRMA